MYRQAALCDVLTEKPLPHVTVPAIYAVDWEGVIGNIEATFGHMLAVAEPLLGSKSIAGILAWPGNRSFLLHRVLGTLSPEDRIACGQQFLDTHAEAPDDILYKDGAGFLARLAYNTPHLITTAGQGSAWPHGRVALGMRRTEGAIYAESTDKNYSKGRHVAAWLSPCGTFDSLALDEARQPIAVVHALGTVVVDDRGKAFSGLPAQAGGIHVDHEGRGERIHPDGNGRVISTRTLDNVHLPRTWAEEASCSPVPAHPNAHRAAYYQQIQPIRNSTGIAINAATTFPELYNQH